ncbi:glycosyltransferase family 4 protein [Pelistega ratti]|uniref:glycosyltransferase family 4 protein n=1 Tax=Pelistega ratti TaxID=2652177 RepID=UPI00135B1BCE|nr:glycosyltransferase family 4 protein [Pelistega ratti]
MTDQILSTPQLLYINMASGYGGGEVQTEELIKHIKGYKCFFLGKPNGKLVKSLQQQSIDIVILSFLQALKLAYKHKNLIVHAQDGRSVHIALLIKCLTGTPYVITRRVYKPLKRKLSVLSYRQADFLVGISHQITKHLKQLNPNSITIYGSVKPTYTDEKIEQQYFPLKTERLKVAHIGNLQAIKNFPLTISLAKALPDIDFFIVGSGTLEAELKQQARGIENLTFIPATKAIGSIFKNIDVQLVPSHSEGLGNVILEAYQYNVPTIAHKVGGMIEIIEDGKTGFLVKDNDFETYKTLLLLLKRGEISREVLKSNIQHFKKTHDFSAERMAKEYSDLYRKILPKT